MKKYVYFLLIFSFFIFPSVSHAAWWEYVNDKTIISFIKSLFTDSEFVSSKYEFYKYDVVENKPASPESVNTTPAKSPAAAHASASASAPAPIPEVAVSMVDGPALNVSAMSYTKSDNSLVVVDSAGAVSLKTTPTVHSSWISFSVTTTKPSNYVYLDLDFTSAVLSQGVFDVLFDGKDLGYMDERFFDAGSKRLVMGYSTKPAGTYTVMFRLDQFGDLPSSTLIKNIGTGFFNE